MCTLTWTRARGEATGPEGYRLWFNRDELRSRGPEVPPRVEETASGLRYVAAADPDADALTVVLRCAVVFSDGASSSSANRFWRYIGSDWSVEGYWAFA